MLEIFFTLALLIVICYHESRLSKKVPAKPLKRIIIPYVTKTVIPESHIRNNYNTWQKYVHSSVRQADYKAIVQDNSTIEFDWRKPVINQN